jgi:hypothetical protein
MRIQQTDQILKEARINRNHNDPQQHGRSSTMWSRAWQSLTGIFKRS